MKYLEVSLEFISASPDIPGEFRRRGGFQSFQNHMVALLTLHIADASTGARSTCVTSPGNTSGYLDLSRLITTSLLISAFVRQTAVKGEAYSKKTHLHCNVMPGWDRIAVSCQILLKPLWLSPPTVLLGRGGLIAVDSL
jgi:hypothetical protein